MTEQTQAASSPAPSTPVDPVTAGTSQAVGQSAQSTQQNNQSDDPVLMRADYTRKTQEIAEQRRQLEAERQEFLRQRQMLQSQPQQQPQNIPAQNPQQDYQQLVDTFGVEAAQILWRQQQFGQQQTQQTQLQLLTFQEDSKGRNKYGAEWDKHAYVDPMTGQPRNKVLDLRMSINPLTGQALTLEQAWVAANVSDIGSFQAQIEQQAKDKAYQEFLSKQQGTPASGSAPKPTSTAVGHAKSIDEAFNQAAAELGM